eukprot:TRINITY_DN65533_c0_g2_i2.p1 TRINITY_DN65533_c0_g2~~TRINITY_DN65533_c0_g2_i2.p1  ORF type:complete len:152 (-),score=3.23 TRINITY_DN65533_c0_g2_i2:107-562(-)
MKRGDFHTELVENNPEDYIYNHFTERQKEDVSKLMIGITSGNVFHTDVPKELGWREIIPIEDANVTIGRPVHSIHWLVPGETEAVDIWLDEAQDGCHIWTEENLIHVCNLVGDECFRIDTRSIQHKDPGGSACASTPNLRSKACEGAGSRP